VDKELQRAEEKKQQLIGWLNLDQTKKIRKIWDKELKAARAALETLRPEHFKDSLLYLMEMARLQEAIRLRKTLVEAPEAALLVKENIIRGLEERTVEEHN